MHRRSVVLGQVPILLTLLGTLLLGTAANRSASAAECATDCQTCCRNCRLPSDTCCCPNTYGPKPLPCVRCEPMCCPDCYCPKPLPVVCCQPMCCSDTYCRKPFPDLCYGPPPVPYTCGPCDRGHCPPVCATTKPTCTTTGQGVSAGSETAVVVAVQPAKTAVAQPALVPQGKKTLRIVVR